VRSIHQKEARFARAGFIGLAAIAALTVLLCSGCGAESGGGDDDNLPKLEYVGKVCDTSETVSSLAVSYDGLIFMHAGFSSQDDYIRVCTVEGEDRGIFKDKNGNNIGASLFFIDKSNLVNVIDKGFMTSNTFYRYRTDGTLYDKISLEDAPSFPLTMDSVALLDNGSFVNAYTGGTVVDSLSIRVFSLNFEVVHSLMGSDVAAMIPGFADDGATGTNGYFTGVGAGYDGEICIAVEFNEGSHDGILVLNSDLTKKKYVSGDWAFNCPFDVATDGNGYHYVSNMSNDNLKVLDKSWSKVATTDPDDSESPKVDSPGVLCVRGDDVYVYSYGSPTSIHRFKTYKDCPDETAAADPEHLSGGSGGGDDPNNDAPVINIVYPEKFYNYDVNGNYMYGIFTYTASVVDPEGDSFDYEWELVQSVSGGGASLINNGSKATVTAYSFDSGYVILTVTDEHGATATYTCDSYGHP